MDNVSLAVHRYVCFLLIIKFDSDHGRVFSLSLSLSLRTRGFDATIRCYHRTPVNGTSFVAFPYPSRRASRALLEVEPADVWVFFSRRVWCVIFGRSPAVETEKRCAALHLVRGGTDTFNGVWLRI